MQKDDVFRIVAYCVSIYLILIPNSTPINTVGWIIMVAHLYKDATGMTHWPHWTEFCGMVLAGVLVYSGWKIDNSFVVCLGVLKLAAHARQCILQDNRYYY